MPALGFEPTPSAGERQQTYALDRAATGTGTVHKLLEKNFTVTIWLIINKYPYCGFRIDDNMLSGRLLPIFENKKEPRKRITMQIDALHFLNTPITIT